MFGVGGETRARNDIFGDCLYPCNVPNSESRGRREWRGKQKDLNTKTWRIIPSEGFSEVGF